MRIPQGVHYHTTEGAFAILPFNSPYTIQLRNIDERLRCSALVENNGKIAGEWTIDPKGFIVLERPAMDQKKFHFMEARCAPSGSGVRLDDPNNGVICVTFTPEKDETLNDLSRGRLNSMFNNISKMPHFEMNLFVVSLPHFFRHWPLEHHFKQGLIFSNISKMLYF